MLDKYFQNFQYGLKLMVLKKVNINIISVKTVIPIKKIIYIFVIMLMEFEKMNVQFILWMVN